MGCTVLQCREVVCHGRPRSQSRHQVTHQPCLVKTSASYLTVDSELQQSRHNSCEGEHMCYCDLCHHVVYVLCYVNMCTNQLWLGKLSQTPFTMQQTGTTELLVVDSSDTDWRLNCLCRPRRNSLTNICVRVFRLYTFELCRKFKQSTRWTIQLFILHKHPHYKH